jgi:RNA polymerase sigma-70 factor (ECF subfamily)
MNAYQPNSAEPDAVLLQRAQAGDATAFGELYQRYVSAIYNYCYQRTSSVPDAEDLTARTFHQALKNLNRYVYTGAPFTAWLYRIAHNLVANWHRSQRRRPTIPLTEALGLTNREDSPLAQAETQEEYEALRAAIRRLPVARQQVLILRFSHDLTNREIGTITGRSEGAVKVLIHRSLKALRKELAEHID